MGKRREFVYKFTIGTKFLISFYIILVFYTFFTFNLVLVILCTFFFFILHCIHSPSGELTLRNISCSTLLVVSLVRLWFKIRPVLENIRSQGTDVATMLQWVTNISFRWGYTNWCFSTIREGSLNFLVGLSEVIVRRTNYYLL